MSVRIPVYGRGDVVAYALVDEADAELVEPYRWNLLTGKGYVYHRASGTYMHRLVLGLARGDKRQGDHINRDPLDNRRENLRIATNAQNGQNKPSYGGTSAYRGVSRARSKWSAVVVLNGEFHRLGHFDDELEAARAAARFRHEHMPFAVENAELLGEAA